MKTGSAIPIALVGLLASAASGAPQEAAPAEVRVVDSDWPPFFFKGQTDTEPGIAKEILLKCIPIAGARPVFSFLPVARLFESFKEGAVDLAIFTRTAERESYAIFGNEAIFELRYRPIVKKGRKLDVAKIPDFDGLKLGRLAGLQYPNEEFLKYVEKREAERNLEIFKTPEAGLRMLVEGRIDTFVGNVESTLYLAKKLGMTENVEVIDFNVKTAPYFVAQAKASQRLSARPTFLRKVDDCIASMKRNGSLNELLNQYGIR